MHIFQMGGSTTNYMIILDFEWSKICNPVCQKNNGRSTKVASVAVFPVSKGRFLAASWLEVIWLSLYIYNIYMMWFWATVDINLYCICIYIYIMYLYLHTHALCICFSGCSFQTLRTQWTVKLKSWKFVILKVPPPLLGVYIRCIAIY